MVFMAVPLCVDRRSGRKSAFIYNKYSTSKVLLPEKRLNQRKNCTLKQSGKKIGTKTAKKRPGFSCIPARQTFIKMSVFSRPALFFTVCIPAGLREIT